MVQISPAPAPAPPAITAHQRATLIVACAGNFMTLLDVSIVNTALPAIQRGLHSSFSQLQWVVDAYSVAFAVLLLTVGAVSDRYGRKRLFQIGMATFALGSLLCGLSTSSAELDAARVFQGIGGAALAPTALALLAAAFPDDRQRVRAVSLWAAISGIALAPLPVRGSTATTSQECWRGRARHGPVDLDGRRHTRRAVPGQEPDVLQHRHIRPTTPHTPQLCHSAA